jgi:3-keto-disaccharide hydrolase
MRRLLLLLLWPALALQAQPNPAEWKSLFDGNTFGHWKQTQFTGSPAVHIENGAIILTAGKPLTGVTWSGAFPESNYELRFEGVRLLGGDFFASVTFPAGRSFATWVLGGWGGDIVGISSIDGWDASDNETRSYFNFETGRWYAFRLQVTGDRIMAWIDGQRVINVEIRGRAVSLRHGDIKLSAPLGFASYNTTGGVRKIEYRATAAKQE